MTGAIAEPLVAVFGKVEAVGGERIAKSADRTTFVVIAAQGPESLVVVSLMSAEIDDAASFEDVVDDAQDARIAKGGITGDVLDVERGKEGSELEKLGSERELLASVGGREVVEQDNVEAARGVSKEKRQAGVAIARLALFGISLFLIRVGLIGAAVADETCFWVTWGGFATD